MVVRDPVRGRFRVGYQSQRDPRVTTQNHKSKSPRAGA